MMNIVICEDERVEIEYLTMLIRRWADRSGISTRISDYQSAESFLFYYEDDKSADILLLDIQMGSLNGFELAKIIRKKNEIVQIAFITGVPDFVSEGYDVSALHYLMKPVNEDKLFEVLDKAYKRKGEAKKSLIINSDNRNHRILFDDIVYIEAFRNSVVIVTTGGQYEVQQNISRIEKELDNSFFRCQRSYIVMLKHIKYISKTDVLMDNGIIISLSRTVYNDLYRAFINYFKAERERK